MVTQVVVTPEYAALTVTDGGSIVGAPWDGVLGGGGGSGWSRTSYSSPSAGGANGGGIILAHANHLGGAGLWSAQGASPAIFGGGDWGYGGAGAGGSVLLRAAVVASPEIASPRVYTPTSSA